MALYKCGCGQSFSSDSDRCDCGRFACEQLEKGMTIDITQLKHLDDLLNIKAGAYILEEVKQHLILGGSAAMAIRGWRPNNDLDVGVTDELIWSHLMMMYPYRLTNIDKDEKLTFGPIELFFRYENDQESRFNQPTEVIDGLRFWTLEGLMKWKVLMGRTKDQIDIQILKSNGIK